MCVAGPGPGPCALYFVQCEVRAPLHQHQDLANQHLDDTRGQERCTRVLELLERPAQRERDQNGWCDRCVGTQLPNRTPRLHLRLAFDIDVQTKTQSRARLTLAGRLLVMGNAATILKSVRQRTREKRRRQTIAHRQCLRLPALSAYLPTYQIQPSHTTLPYTERVRRLSTAQKAGHWTGRVE